MGETSVGRQDDFYLKGKSRHMFWLVLAVLPLCFWGYRFLPSVFLASNYSLYELFSVFSSVIVCVLLFVYGLKSKLKAQRALLIILPLLCLPELAHHSIYILSTPLQDSIIKAMEKDSIPLVLYNYIPEFVFNGAWLTCLIVQLSFSRTGRTLRFACVPLILFYGCLTYENVKYLLGGVATYYFFLDYYLLAFRLFFFAALSFSRESNKNVKNEPLPPAEDIRLNDSSWD